jgi:biofilm PGA synthesis N-glycosyltransferase PgaC
MTGGALSYAAISPVRDEVENLPRLAGCLIAQTIRPEKWIIVENGSTDGTLGLAFEFAASHDWIEVIIVPGEARATRGRPIVRSFHAGLAQLSPRPPVIVNLDADISFGPDYFERLLSEFATDPELGIASGSASEFRRGRWRQRHVTGSTVWGASRAYRRECLETILPLEERLGWDGIDEFKANASGWRTRTLTDLHFLHHRTEGNRDGAWRMRTEQGRMAYYVGYRFWYLTLRAFYNAVRSPSALGLLWGYLLAVVHRDERMPDEAARAYLRKQQDMRNLPRRAREALGKTPSRAQRARRSSRSS